MLVLSTPLHAPPLSANERMILDIVRRLGPIARAAITGETNLTQQSVHRIIEELLEKGLLKLGAVFRGARGHPSPRVELNRQAWYSFGLSINTDSAVISLVDMACGTVDEERLLTQPLSRAKTEADAKAIMERMLKRNAVARDQLIGLGVGSAGYFIRGRSQINAPEPMQDWSLVDILPDLEATFGLPVRLENNGTTAAIGELFRGVGKVHRSFGYLSFNYGFGGGIVIDGRPIVGSFGNAGEFSAMFTIEERPHRPALRTLVETLQAHGVKIGSVADLAQQFDPDWPGVQQWIERVLPALNRVINTIAAVNDPEAIVFGGQVPKQLAAMLVDRAEYWGQHRYGIGMRRPELLVSQVEGDAAASGAAMMPIYEAFFHRGPIGL